MKYIFVWSFYRCFHVRRILTGDDWRGSAECATCRIWATLQYMYSFFWVVFWSMWDQVKELVIGHKKKNSVKGLVIKKTWSKFQLFKMFLARNLHLHIQQGHLLYARINRFEDAYWAGEESYEKSQWSVDNQSLCWYEPQHQMEP